MEKAYLMVTIRDINLLCQHYKTYAQLEGETRRRKINHARRRKGILEVRTAARDCFNYLNLSQAARNQVVARDRAA